MLRSPIDEPMIGDLLDVVVTAIAEVLPWRAFVCIGIALLLALVVCGFLGASVSWLTIFVPAAVVGLAAGVFWESRSP